MNSNKGLGIKIAAPRFAAVCAALCVHAALLLFAAFSVKSALPADEQKTELMRLADIRERLPETPRAVSPPAYTPPAAEVPSALTLPPEGETIAETVVEGEGDRAVDGGPGQGGEAENALPAAVSGVPAASGGEAPYLPAHQVSVLPRFDERELKQRITYPALARRAGIEGTVYLEILVDAAGFVRGANVLRENPPNRGFGEAAARAFTGLKAAPALRNGAPVACRYRYPVRFELGG